MELWHLRIAVTEIGVQQYDVTPRIHTPKDFEADAEDTLSQHDTVQLKSTLSPKFVITPTKSKSLSLGVRLYAT
jgi:hypothetical protein